MFSTKHTVYRYIAKDSWVKTFIDLFLIVILYTLNLLKLLIQL